MEDPLLSKKMNDIQLWMMNAMQMQEPTIIDVEQYIPKKINKNFFIEVVEAFYAQVNRRVMVEVVCYKMQDKEELERDFNDIFKMIVMKINISLKHWYKQLWVKVLAKHNLKLTETEQSYIFILYKDIERF